MPPKRRENSSASKKKKMKKQQQSSSIENNSSSSSSSRDDDGAEEEDRISSLPEANLHLILSYLDMKHAGQTSILSKRWRDLWTSLPYLSFDSESFYSPTTKRFDGFNNFVDQVLLLRDKYCDIDSFHLQSIICYSIEINSRLNTWIVSAIRSKVRQLIIDIWGCDRIRLPNSLFTCNTLTRLILSLCGNERWSITLPAADSSMCLPNLKVLELYSVSFHDENLTNKFFSSFPILEKLYLGNVKFLHMNLNISCLKLTDLAIDNHFKSFDGYCLWPNTKFKLHAPGLLDLTCKDFMSKDYILEDLPFLVKADIHMKVEEVENQNPGLLIYSRLPAERKQMYAERMMRFLRPLHFVKDLKLSAWFLEVFSGSLDLLEGGRTELCDLTCLRLETWLSIETIRAIAYLLKISPNIQSLFLEISQVGSENEGSHLETEMSFQCLLHKLEIVEIQGAVGCADELNFLEVLLKNANALKKLVVCTSTESSADSKKRFRKFSEKILMFPRASSNISILFY